MKSRAQTVGVVSDTHGLVRPQILEIFQGADVIIHAGDIGRADVLETLRTVAPVFAVRGNNDRDPWAARIPLTETVEVGRQIFFVLHELEHLELDPVACEFRAVIYGHSHRPSAEYRRDVLYLNPGSAGPRRFSLPVSVGRLSVRGGRLDYELIELSV